MREYAKVSTSIWNSQKFDKVGDDARLLYLYLHTYPHGNAIGCFVLKVGYVTEDLRWTAERYQKALESLSEAFLIAFDTPEKLVRIVDFIKNDPFTNPNQAAGALKQAANLPNCHLKVCVLKDFLQQKHVKISDVEVEIERLGKGFRKAFETQTRPEPDPEPLPVPEPVPEPLKDSCAISAKSRASEDPEFELEIEAEKQLDPIDACFDFYNGLCDATGWPKVQVRSDARRKALGARIKSIGGAENWQAQIRIAARSNYLTGKVNGWQANFDWLCIAGNFAKVVEGNYQNKGETHDPRFLQANGEPMTKAQKQEVLDWAHIARGREQDGLPPDPQNPLTTRWRDYLTEGA